MRYSVDNLCYQLLQGEVCLEPLRVLARREIAWKDGRVVFFGLGASHAVQVEVNGVCVTELLTCAPLTVPARVLASRLICGSGSLDCDLPGLKFHTLIEPISLLANTDWNDNRMTTDQITVAYPPHAEGQSPITRIGWKICGARLIVETLHTYPEEARGARSRSYFRLLPPLPPYSEAEAIKEIRA